MDRDKIYSRIWITKKSRQNAESRLIKVDTILNYLLVYYSSLLIAFQLVPLYFPLEKEKQFNWITTTLSLFVLLFSVVITSSNFRLQAEKMKNSYLNLNSLEYEISFNSSPNLAEVSRRYTDILDKTENHLTWDYEKLFLWKKTDPNEQIPSVVFRHAKHYVILGFIYIMVTIGFIFPLVICYRYVVPFLG